MVLLLLPPFLLPSPPRSSQVAARAGAAAREDRPQRRRRAPRAPRAGSDRVQQLGTGGSVENELWLGVGYVPRKTDVYCFIITEASPPPWGKDR